MSLEPKRSILEELDAIEAELALRILKSDQFLPLRLQAGLGKRTYSARENAVRRFEAAQLADKYHELTERWHKLPADISSFDSELKEAKKLSDDLPALNKISAYKLHSDRAGLLRFTCDNTVSVLDDLHKYPPQEQFGKVLWLEPFYSKLQDPNKPSTYREYLVNLPQYVEHGGTELALCLESYYNRAYSVGKHTDTLASDIVPTKQVQDKLYCEPCGRKFANDNVFSAHLTGKKHLRASKQPQRHTLIDTTELLALLKPDLDRTIANLDRKLALTFDERKLEVEALTAERLKEDEFISDDEKDIDDEPSSRPLRGAEGVPIPRWLFKLHGLGAVFTCEICGFDVKYSGRKAFERHFTSKDSPHTVGLRQLGIQPSPAYTGISTISEAKELRDAMVKKAKKSEKEVEDDEGNVMGYRMYEDLKRQGLI